MYFEKSILNVGRRNLTFSRLPCNLIKDQSILSNERVFKKYMYAVLHVLSKII